MPTNAFRIAVLVLASIVLASCDANSAPARDPAPRPAPAFTHSGASEWINSKPLRLADLRGRVVLLDFWAFDCWNCYRSFPWLNDLQARLATQPFTVLGVHSPELDHERDRGNVVAKVREFALHHPVMIDNDFSYWRALDNQYWPAYYVIDKQGRIRGTFVGETHKGDARAQAIEQLVAALLKEPTAQDPEAKDQ